MRLATIIEHRRPLVAVVRDDRCLSFASGGGPGVGLATMRDVAACGPDGLRRIAEWIDAQPAAAWRPLDAVELGPAVPDPGAIYTIGLNYAPGGPGGEVAGGTRPPRPLIYGKLPSSVAAHGSTLRWDRSLTANVDPEAELGVVIGRPASAVDPASAMDHVFGYTGINDVSSRDDWLDGDQWLLGKSMAGFCPVGPWVVTADELDPTALRLGCTINGAAIQDGSTADLRFSIAEIVAFLSRHVDLRPGDLIATGTPARLATPPGPDRDLEPGDVVTIWIDGIGELTTTIG